MQPTIEQLDLTLYEPSFIAWWRHPLILGVGIVCVVVILTVLWVGWLRLRRRHGMSIDVPGQTTIIIVSAEQKLQDQAITAVQALATLTSALKRYTAWRCADEAICAFTDQQWLAYVKKQELFELVIDDCADLVKVAEQIKFNYAQWALDDVARLLQKGVKMVSIIESAYQNMAKKAQNKQT